jgi:hypothetical protein
VVLTDHGVNLFDWGSTLGNLIYLSEAYGTFAASALASSILRRTKLGAVIPLVSHGESHNLGVGWRCSLLGSISILFIPIPFTLNQVSTSARGAIRMLIELSASMALPYVHGRS